MTPEIIPHTGQGQIDVFSTESGNMEQGLRQDSEAATINELTNQSKRIPC